MTADTFILANADTVMSRSNEALLDEVFPGVARKRPVGEHETLLSIDKARRVLGYEPRVTLEEGLALDAVGRADYGARPAF